MATANKAALAARLAQALDYVGVLCVEFFVLQDGSLVANEMAPRPHNSGHYSIDACVTSQFEQQARVLAGLPLGDTAPRGYAAMVNLIGTLPERSAVLAIPGAHLHDYGKAPRPGRKLGHITLVEAERTALQAKIDRIGAL